MPIYGIHEAKTRLSHLVRLAERGEIITITRAYQPVALLVRIGATPQARRPGTLRETLKIDPALDTLDALDRAPRELPRPAHNRLGTLDTLDALDRAPRVPPRPAPATNTHEPS